MLPSLSFGGGNLNLSVFSSTANSRVRLFSPFGGVATVSSSSPGNDDWDYLSALESCTEGSIIVGWRRYRTLHEIHVEKPSSITIFSQVKILTEEDKNE